MRARQTIPHQWLIVADRDAGATIRRMPPGSGVLLLYPAPAAEIRRLRQIATARDLTIVRERRGIAARVHNVRELRRALLDGTQLILLSPLYPTASHPEWKPIPRMRAAALARLGGRRLIALGGMDAKSYARFARLGFIGWAGISAWVRT